MEQRNIAAALIEFINARPAGNILREIGERTLVDLMKQYEVTSERPFLMRSFPIEKKERYEVRNVKRILPAIHYKKIRKCKT